jgi:hypothetical protein
MVCEDAFREGKNDPGKWGDGGDETDKRIAGAQGRGEKRKDRVFGNSCGKYGKKSIIKRE